MRSLESVAGTDADRLVRCLMQAVTTGGEVGLEMVKQIHYSASEPVWRFVMLNTRVGYKGGSLCHMAAGHNQWLIYRYFIEHGSNSFTVDYEQRLPSEVARDCGHVCTAIHIKCLYETL